MSKRMPAVLIRILDETGIRIGNESYAKENGSYGLTTLLGKHLTLHKNSVELRFPGKSHQQQQIMIEDALVVRFLKKLKRKPGKPLFRYEQEDTYHSVDARDVNALLQDLSGYDISAKDFRTWVASARFAQELAEQEPAEDKQRKAIVTEAIANVADFLGHTTTICRKYYLHPGLAEAFLQGEFSPLLKSFRKRRCKWLRHEDRLLIHILSRLDS